MLTNLEPLEAGGRRPGHPRHRTVGQARRAAESGAPPGPGGHRWASHQAQRRRAGHLAVLQALLGFHLEARWLRYADRHLRQLLPYLPGQSGDNKRLRHAAELLRHAIWALAADTSLWTEDVWLVDSTPMECGRSRDTAKRSDRVGWAAYGWCASHSRWFWGYGCTWCALCTACRSPSR